MIITEQKECEDCLQLFIGSRFCLKCKYCERTKTLDRIAYALERMLYYQFGEEV